MSVALAYDERRIAAAFDRIDAVAQSCSSAACRRARRGPAGADRRGACHPAAAGRSRRPRREARRAVGPSRARALLGAPRRRVRSHQRGRAIARKLDVIRETADTHHRSHRDAHQPPAGVVHHRADRARDRARPLRPILEVAAQPCRLRARAFRSRVCSNLVSSRSRRTPGPAASDWEPAPQPAHCCD